MANTTNLNLVKPAGTDKALVSVLNANSDKIDAFAGTTNQALSHYYNTNGVLKTLNGIDVRTITEAGRYYCVECTNLPGGAGYGYLDVYIYNANYRRLLFHEASYAHMYTTRLQNGTWQAWQELAIVGSERSENLTSKASVTSGSVIINNVYLNRNGPVGVLTINVKAPNSPIPIGQSSIISIQDLKIHGFVTGCGFSGNTVMVATGSTSNNVASINVRPIAAQLEANYSSAIAIPCILSE